MRRAGWLTGGILAAALVLGGCGVRGGLEQSDEAKAATAAEKKVAAEPAAPGQPAPQKPFKPFILDGLIR